METVQGEPRLRKPLMIAAAGVLVVAVALGLNHFLFDDSGRRAGQEAAGTQAVPEAAPAPGDAAGGGRPRFDVVRVNPQGDAVMAGRAAPGSAVTILDGERVLGEVKADENGEWVFVPDDGLPPGERRLTLRIEDAGGKRVGSEETVVLIVPEKGKDIAGRPAGAEAQALALRLGPGGSSATVLQAPSSSATEAPPVSIQSVDYGQSGSATVSGRAAPGATVQLYLDNAFAGRTEAGADGSWRIVIETPPNAEKFALRADEVSAGGQVTARVAVPFSRGEKGMQPGPAVTSVVVLPGGNLWRIARRTLGSGVAYTAIYEANKSQILDPNLIYPGQVFSVPPSN